MPQPLIMRDSAHIPAQYNIAKANPLRMVEMLGPNIEGQDEDGLRVGM
jgi:hypothetical protein